MDQSTSVREAAVELVGRFILIKPELTHQYYEMIMERILVSVYSVVLLRLNSRNSSLIRAIGIAGQTFLQGGQMALLHYTF